MVVVQEDIFSSSISSIAINWLQKTSIMGIVARRSDIEVKNFN